MTKRRKKKGTGRIALPKGKTANGRAKDNATHPNLLRHSADLIPSKSKCQDCQETFNDGDLAPIDDIYERVSPGEIMPSGECPKCGALCQPIDSTEGLNKFLVISCDPEDGTFYYDRVVSKSADEAENFIKKVRDYVVGADAIIEGDLQADVDNLVVLPNDKIAEEMRALERLGVGS